MTQRLLDQAPDDTARVQLAYTLCFARPPASEELAAAKKFLAATQDKLRAAGKSPDQLAKETWRSYVRVLFRLNEFVYVD